MKLKMNLLEPSTSALDFAPEILAIEKRPPSPLPRAVLYTLLLLVAILLVGSLVGKLDIVATAQGKLVPQTYVKIVQPAEAGVVTEILVTEGDRVRAGQVLLRLDTTLSTADAAIVGREFDLRALQIRRIDAELSGQPMARCDSNHPSRRTVQHSDPLARHADEGLTMSDSDFSCGSAVASQMFAEVEAQARARQRAYRDALQTEQALLSQAGEELLAAQAQAVKLERLLPIFAQEVVALADLAKQGLVPKFQYAEKQREHIETEQNLASQRRTVTSLESRVAESRSRIARVTSDYRQQLLTERVEAQAALERARQELAKQEHRGRLNELRAPQDGVIKDVATYTVGAVVGAGTVLMSLVPVDEELVAEVFIKNEDVGFVREGQSVKLKLAAFPFQKYGMMEGTVKHIAADAAQMQSSGEQSAQSDQADLSPYRAIVQLKQQTLNSRQTDWPLAPGMRVVAEMREGERTVMEYVLSPVRKAAHEAARER